MRPLLTAVALLTLAAFAPADEPKTPPTKKADPPAEKKEEKKQPFTSKEGKFSVVFPAEGKITEESKKTDTGKAAFTQHMFALELGSTAYLASYQDVINNADDVDSDKALDLAISGMLKGMKAKEVSTTKIKVHGEKGRETVFEVPEKKWFGRIRIVVVGARLYQVIVLGTDEKLPGADDFLQSLTFTDLPKEKKDDK